jgi:hypothetical protein
MIREERTSFLAGLTLFMYALIQWFENGIFLFPFPLNELVISIVYCYFLFLNKWKITRFSLFLGLAILFKLLSQQLFWSFFLSNQSLEILYDGIWTDVSYMLYAFSWFGFSIFYLRSGERTNSYLSILSTLLPFLVGVLMNQPFLECISFLIIFGSSYYFKLDRAYRSLIGLILFLELGKLVMLL